MSTIELNAKAATYGRKNPITARWNSEDQLVLWRAAWADTTNRFLERVGSQERVDHRSHAERGLDEQPTIHEGVAARALERKGIMSDRCELNRQIRADNALLQELKELVKKLVQTVKNTSKLFCKLKLMRSCMMACGRSTPGRRLICSTAMASWTGTSIPSPKQRRTSG